MLYLSTKIGDITVEQLGQMLLFGMIVMAIVTVIFYAIAKNKRDSEDYSQPVRAATVTVVDKQQPPVNAIAFELWVLFETQHGERVRVMCPANNSYIVGDVGYLRWQGSKLHSFDRESKESSAGRPVFGTQGHIPAWKRVEMMETQTQESKTTQSRSCVFCGQSLQEGQIFCGSCGKRQD